MLRCCFLLLLVSLARTECRRSKYVLPIFDSDQGSRQRHRVLSNIYGCRGYCDSGSKPEQVNLTLSDGQHSSMVTQVSACKCCRAMETELKTFSIPTRQGGRLQEKTYEIWSAVSCGCQTCGPDVY